MVYTWLRYRPTILQRWCNFGFQKAERIKAFLTLIPLMWRIWCAPNNARRWQMGFNSAFKGLTGSAIRVSGRNLLCGAGELPNGPKALNFQSFLVN
jgi:hypothetical protein